MSDDAFYWLVDAEYELSDFGIDTGSSQFRLTDEARTILNGPGGRDAFHRACGDYFYSASKGDLRLKVTKSHPFFDETGLIDYCQ